MDIAIRKTSKRVGLVGVVCDNESIVLGKVHGFDKLPTKHLYKVSLEFQRLFKFALKESTLI